MRESLHLSIDPSPYSSSTLQYSPESGSPSSSSRQSTDTSPTSSYSDIIYSALCMYDFHSDDPIHLPFRRNEILDILRIEPTGWWAATRRGSDSEIVGWIPGAFVKPISEEMTDRLMNVRPELRIYEYDAEQLYNTAPTTRIPFYDLETETQTPYKDRKQGYQGGYDTDPQTQREAWSPRRQAPEPSLVTPLPTAPSRLLPKRNSSLQLNKPTTPTPKEPDISRIAISTPTIDPDSFRRPPPRLLPLQEPEHTSDSSKSPDSASKRSDGKIKQLTGSDEALIHYNSVLMQANMPWYLKPRYSNELDTDNDGKVLRGSRRALVEKLVWEPPIRDTVRAAQDTAYRTMFLTTFRTFMSAQDLFDILVDHFRTEPPADLTDEEFAEWRDKYRNTMQRTILNIFLMWLEEHRLLEEEPYIATPLTDFLNLIKTPHLLAEQSQLIVEAIKRLTFSTPSHSFLSSLKPSRKYKKDPKGDLLRLDPADVAEQLCLLEFRLYRQITPPECIRYAKVQTGKPVEHLSAFCSTHDKIAAWVTMSVLDISILAKRADTVDFWIKVAEKCRTLNNFASMSAIINALSSTVIVRLYLTWAHVGRKHTLEGLLKYNELTGGFSGYRNLQQNAEGSYIPFVGMYLSDILHIKDQYVDDKDSVDPNQWKISVTQRQRWYEVTRIMLRSQCKPYKFSENRATMEFITRATASIPKDWQSKAWAKSQVVQHSEIANADIRRGLEAAGF